MYYELSSYNLSSPVIGVLSIPVTELINQKSHSNIRSYIDSNYIKWLQSEGAKVVIIHFDWSLEKIYSVLEQVNGVLLTGGSVKLRYDRDFYYYLKSFNFIYQYAISKHDFPIWTTCLAFEIILLLQKYNYQTIYHSNINSRYNSNTDLRDYVPTLATSVPFHLVSKNIIKNDFFKFFNLNYINYLNNPCCFMDHTWGIEYNEEMVALLEPNITIISTNIAENKKQYISTFKFKKYPIYGVQWHPEKVLFDWENPAILHDTFSKYISRMCAKIFIDACHLNSHSLHDQSLLVGDDKLYSRDVIMKHIGMPDKNKKYRQFKSYYFLD